MEKTYIAIDLKSFYASVECVERGLDPLEANLVVADESRTEKTICLAVSPALKALGISGRARLYEALQTIEEENRRRLYRAPGHRFTGKSFHSAELAGDPSLELDLVIAPPQMSKYMYISTLIFDIYKSFVSPEDIHVYSIDEVFMDATGYLETRGVTAREFAMQMIHKVLDTTGITATAGIGTNMYLAKVAMDIVAKHIPADKDGVRIAELDEAGYREQLWNHRPLTDFWRVGRGYARRLESNYLFTMGDIARCSVHNEDLLYRLFGVNAELLIDHAWGWEPCTIKDIKGCRPKSSSLSSGQVLSEPYECSKGRLIVREMTDLLVLDMAGKGLVTDQMVLTVCYDVENLNDSSRAKYCVGAVGTDFYGRPVPESSHGSINLGGHTCSTRHITEAVMELYDRIANPNLLVRRFYVVANHVMPESALKKDTEFRQLDLFTDQAEQERLEKEREEELRREKRRQAAILSIQKKYGKTSLLKGMNLSEGATTRERLGQVGGHKA